VVPAVCHAESGPSVNSDLLVLPAWLGCLLKELAELPVLHCDAWNDLGSICIQREIDESSARRRELFPPPAASGLSCGSLFHRWQDRRPLMKLLNAAALNALAGYGNHHPRGAAVAPSASQRAALESVAGKVDRLCGRLRRLEDPGCKAAVRQTLLGNAAGPGARAVPLVASACDVLERSALVDPTPSLPAEWRHTATDAAAMFPSPPPGLDRFAGPKGSQRNEYLRLMFRELRSGKSELRRGALGGGSVFAVGKTSGRQRAIWDGKRVTAAAVRPPKQLVRDLA